MPFETFQQFDDSTDILNDIDRASELTLDELRLMQADRQAFTAQRQEFNERLRGQGLSDEQIAQVEDAQRQAQAAGVSSGGPSPRAPLSPRQASGVAEGIIQAGEGLADLAMDGSVLLTDALQIPETLATTLGMDTDESREAWKANVSKARTQRRIDQIEEFGQLPPGGAEFAGEVAPWILGSTGSAARMLTFLARNSFLGGTAAGAHFKPSGEAFEDRLWDMTMGATLGAGIAGVFGIPQIVRRSASRGLVRAFNDADPQQRELVETMIREMTDNPEFTFSAGQITGTRFYNSLEVATSDVATKAANNRNLEVLATNLLRMAKAQSAAGKSAGEIAVGMRETLKTARDSIYNTATKNWGDGATAILETHGDDAIINGRGYLSKIDDMIREEQDALLNMGAKPSENLSRYRDAVDEIVNPMQARQYVDDAGNVRIVVLDRSTGSEFRILGETRTKAQREAMMKDAEKRALAMNEAAGGPSAEQSLKILAGLRRLIGGETAIFENASVGSNRNIGRALMGAFTAEMEGAASNVAARDAVVALREGYRMDMAAAGALDQSVFNAVFGGKKFPKNPGKRLDQILRGETEDVVQMREFLEEWNKPLLDEVRATHLSRIVERSEVPSRPDVDTPLDINKLAKNLADDFGRAGQAGRGLHTPATQADMLLTAKALRILNNKIQGKGPSFGGTRPEEWTINLISRSPEFFGRFVTRLFSSGQTLETALLNPEWRHAIRVIAEQPLTSRAAKGAMLYLVQWKSAADAEQAHIAAQEEQKAAEELAAGSFKGQLGD
jgi:hypothetical protein